MAYRKGSERNWGCLIATVVATPEVDKFSIWMAGSA
jgi:hypothetical protein